MKKSEYTVIFNNGAAQKMYGYNDSEIIVEVVKQMQNLLDTDTLKSWSNRPKMEYRAFKGKSKFYILCSKSKIHNNGFLKGISAQKSPIP